MAAAYHGWQGAFQGQERLGTGGAEPGPLVYCLESVDDSNLDLFNTQIDLGTLRAEHSPDHLGGIWLLRGEMKREETFCAIPLLCLGQPGLVGNGSMASSLALAQSKHNR